MNPEKSTPSAIAFKMPSKSLFAQLYESNDSSFVTSYCVPHNNSDNCKCTMPCVPHPVDAFRANACSTQQRT